MYEWLLAKVGSPLLAVRFLGVSWLWCKLVGFCELRCVFSGLAYGPSIGTIWDPSPETQYHILSLELAAKRVKLESEEAWLTNIVDPTEKK